MSKKEITNSTIEKMIARLLNHPESGRIGMILTHTGIVRAFSRDGRVVDEIFVRCRWERLNGIISEMKKREGIVDILVEINEGLLKVGDKIMHIAVAGEFREKVLSVMSELIDKIKAEVTKKEERYI